MSLGERDKGFDFRITSLIGSYSALHRSCSFLLRTPRTIHQIVHICNGFIQCLEEVLT